MNLRERAEAAYNAKIEREAELKPIGEAAVKRLRKEHGMERPQRYAASDLMLEALKAAQHALTDEALFASDTRREIANRLIAQAIEAAEGKEDSDAER